MGALLQEVLIFFVTVISLMHKKKKTGLKGSPRKTPQHIFRSLLSI
jgi:hypothetical protein